MLALYEPLELFQRTQSGCAIQHRPRVRLDGSIQFEACTSRWALATGSDESPGAMPRALKV